MRVALVFLFVAVLVLGGDCLRIPEDGDSPEDVPPEDGRTDLLALMEEELHEDDSESDESAAMLKPGSFGFRHAMLMKQDDEDDEGGTGREGQNFRSCSVPRCDGRRLKYRTVDGSCNNLKAPNLGMSGTPYKRLLPKKRGLVNCGSSDVRLVNARLASTSLFGRTERDLNAKNSIYLMVFGQLIDHDIELTPLRRARNGEFPDCCRPSNFRNRDCCRIRVPSGDFFYGRAGRLTCIPLLRSKLTSFTGDCGKRILPDVENANTAWIDLSFLYGSAPRKAGEVRAKVGGQLASSTVNSRRIFPPITAKGGFRMVFGDSRNDIQPGLMLVHNAFLRFHNRLAARLARMRPNWSDDLLFEETRKIVTAIGQHITYTEFMDALLGIPNDVRTDDGELGRDYYKPGVDPRITMVFSTAAYRLHTYVGGSFEMRNAEGRISRRLPLREAFNNPIELMTGNNYDDLARGMASQSVRDFNNDYTEDLTEFLLPEKGRGFGLDLVAINIQRGRDHQIPGYVEYRELCGLGSVGGWSDLEDFIPADRVQRLRHSYERLEDVDVYVGANMETPTRGSMLGPTSHCLVREQFGVLRDGDRFFYTRPTEFTARQLAAVKKMSLAHLMCLTADFRRQMQLPKNLFVKANPRTNPSVPCVEFEDLDLDPWG